MMLRRAVFLVIVILIVCVFATVPVRAQLGAQYLPNLSGLARAIQNSAKTMPVKASPGTLYQSGLSVPSVHPGDTARAIAAQLHDSADQQGNPMPSQEKMAAMMISMQATMEASLIKRGFACRDLGTASGICFVTSWETANKKSLPGLAEATLIRAVAAAVGTKWKAQYASLDPAAQEEAYDSLLISPAVLSGLAQSFDKADKPQQESAMRRSAAALFQKVTGVLPSQVFLSETGQITGLAPAPSDPLPIAVVGQGVKQSQIAGIYAQPSYGGGAGGFVSVSYEPVLALKDGSYCAHFEVPPSELNVGASRRSHPGQWGRWRQGADHLEKLSDKGLWERTGWIGPLPETGPGQRLSGRYKSVSGGGTVASGGDIMVAYEDVLVFSPDGQFSADSTASVNSSNVAGGSSKTVSGTYSISLNAITLRYSDGAVKHWSYARTRDGLLFLHGDAYTDDR